MPPLQNTFIHQVSFFAYLHHQRVADKIPKIRMLGCDQKSNKNGTTKHFAKNHPVKIGLEEIEKL